MTHKEAVKDLNTIKEFFEQESGAYPISLDYAIKVLKNELSADRPQGKWISKGKGVYRCSSCGNYLDFDGVNAGRGDANYCPNCGAQMKGADDEVR